MKILMYPDERLKQKCTKVDHFDWSLFQAAQQMQDLMIKNNGAGLAAPQVGIPQRFFVVSKGLMSHDVIVNPTWKPSDNAKSYEATEGCLSFPNLFLRIQRFDEILVEYQDINGKLHSGSMDGFAAHVFQHESDHLVGKLFIDYL